MRVDLRKKRWTDIVGGPFDAIVSATALHWLSPAQLGRLYKQFAGILKPGGIFLNADHAASCCEGIQKDWQNQRNLYCANITKRTALMTGMVSGGLTGER